MLPIIHNAEVIHVFPLTALATGGTMPYVRQHCCVPTSFCCDMESTLQKLRLFLQPNSQHLTVRSTVRTNRSSCCLVLMLSPLPLPKLSRTLTTRFAPTGQGKLAACKMRHYKQIDSALWFAPQFPIITPATLQPFLAICQASVSQSQH